MIELTFEVGEDWSAPLLWSAVPRIGEAVTLMESNGEVKRRVISVQWNDYRHATTHPDASCWVVVGLSPEPWPGSEVKP